ncbi:MAG: SRPBCC domain-containing protein [Methylococcaceae bacterium]|nr:SRPBCC domain-containing protein [Methylococcaceae bacterium]
MLELITEIDISATPQRVWSVLADFPSYSQWNPFIPAIEGEPIIGSRLKVIIQPPGGKSMTFRPTVLVANPNQELRWLGRLFLPGIFDGEHYFKILELGQDRIRFIQGERFSGILVPLAKSALEGGTQDGFVAMNQALKSRVEK